MGCLPALLFAQRTLVYCGKLIDPKAGQVLTEMSIIVTGNTVTAVQKGYIPAAAGDKVIDLKNLTVMPGLIDSHVHLEDQFSANSQLRGFTMNEADIAFQSTVYAKTTLMAGFTTVRDVGGTGVNIALRNAIKKGLVVGPHMYTARQDPFFDRRAWRSHAWLPGRGLYAEPSYTETVCDGPDACIKAVRQMYKEGADLIKITASGGVLSLEKDGLGAQFSDEELHAIVQDGKGLRDGQWPLTLTGQKPSNVLSVRASPPSSMALSWMMRQSRCSKNTVPGMCPLSLPVSR